MKVCVLSDTHWMLNDVHVPECDLLLHAGDLEVVNWETAEKFSRWWNNIDAIRKILIPGNHDSTFAYQTMDNYFHSNTSILINKQVRLENGLVIGGTPYTPTFMNWSFMADDKDLGPKMSCITNECDIILSHGPIYGVHDEVDGRYNKGEKHVGSKTLKKIIEGLSKNKHRYMFHGHIHGNRGKCRHTKVNNVDIYNVSVCNEDYVVVYEPLILEI